MGRVLATLSEFMDEDRLPQGHNNDEEEDNSNLIDNAVHVCNLIKDNEIDHLRELLSNTSSTALA